MIIGVYYLHAVYVFKHVLSNLHQYLHQLDSVYQFRHLTIYNFYIASRVANCAYLTIRSY